MTRNVGSIDRILRIVAGRARIARAATRPRGAWGYIGIVPLLTAFVGYCPAYRLIGLNTCALGDRKA
jgi:hypothetical protein